MFIILKNMSCPKPNLAHKLFIAYWKHPLGYLVDILNAVYPELTSFSTSTSLHLPYPAPTPIQRDKKSVVLAISWDSILIE